MKPGGGNDPSTVAAAVARNLRALRSGRGFTLGELAARSGLSKGMLVQLERGSTNPSIATLCRAADALGISVPRLVEVGDAPVARVVRAEEAVTLWRGRAGGTARLLAGLDLPELSELWDWRLGPRDAYRAEPHPAGTREMLHVLQGVLTLDVDQTRHPARTGETLVFHADRPHGYLNEHDRPLRFLMVVLEPRPPTAPAAPGTKDLKPATRSHGKAQRMTRNPRKVR
jgi:transcriptional regulator with XRE-family HTH domain